MVSACRLRILPVCRQPKRASRTVVGTDKRACHSEFFLLRLLPGTLLLHHGGRIADYRESGSATSHRVSCWRGSTGLVVGGFHVPCVDHRPPQRYLPKLPFALSRTSLVFWFRAGKHVLASLVSTLLALRHALYP
jgi:hypothetical protein